jgi:hypothetical protein
VVRVGQLTCSVAVGIFGATMTLHDSSGLVDVLAPGSAAHSLHCGMLVEDG